jgi:hypothetical protein
MHREKFLEKELKVEIARGKSDRRGDFKPRGNFDKSFGDKPKGCFNCQE